MNKHTCIRIEDREEDYFAGVSSPIEFKAINPSGDFTPFLPDFDRQKINAYESEACVPFSASQAAAIEVQINKQLESGQLPATTVEWLTTNGYFCTDGKVHLSERFVAKVDGTDPAVGTPLQAPWDAMRKYGCLPWSDWPFDESITSDAQFYAPLPQNLLDKAKQFLNYFTIQYHWLVRNGSAKGTPITLLKTALQQAPICIGINVGDNWNQVNPTPTSDLAPEHSVLIVKMDTATTVLDHYQPFLKVLPFSWNIGYAIQGIVTPILPPPPPPTPPITVPATLTWLQKLTAWLQDIQAKMQGARFAGEPPRSNEWPKVRAAHLETEPNCMVCGCSKNLNVHHIMPFHFDQSKELDPDNLITLCQDPKHECHLTYGHWRNYRTKYNPNIKAEAPLWFRRFSAKTEAEALNQ